MRASNWFQQADQAMTRAAARARAVAASTNTPIHIMKDGKIVEIRPVLKDQQPARSKRQENPGLPALREDAGKLDKYWQP